MRTGVDAGTAVAGTSFQRAAALAVLLAASLLAGCNADSGGVDRGQVSGSDGRVALVIGNATYESSGIGSLNNPVRDAEAVATALREVGFKVTVKNDLQNSRFLEALNAFEEASRRAEAAAFYYAGHAMEQGGVNYLIPVDMGRPTGVHEAVELEEVIESMRGERNLVFLDAGRSPSGRTRGEIAGSPLSRGLAVVRVDEETLVRGFAFSYAAEPDTAAEDGEPEGNSPYAAALAAHIGTPGQRLQDLLMEVQLAVSTATEGRQRTWAAGSLGSPFYFVPAPLEDEDEDPMRQDDAWRKDFEVVRGSRSAAAVEAYIRKYEQVPAAGQAVEEARALLTKLTEPVVSEIGMEFVWIPAGSFMMGSPGGEAGREGDEVQHEVRISRGYWMGKYEVTQEEWEAVMGENPSRYSECGARCPVERVSWEDAQEFVGRLNERETGRGYRYRLPSEAEWEYAVRAGTFGATPEGELRVVGERNASELDGEAWYGGNSGVAYAGGYDCSEWEGRQYEAERCGTHPVGMKRANGWGLHDMLGNVWEWVGDWYGEYPSGAVTDPEGPVTGLYRVGRGGSWFSEAQLVRSAFRGYREPGYRTDDIGFRLVRTEQE